MNTRISVCNTGYFKTKEEDIVTTQKYNVLHIYVSSQISKLQHEEQLET